MEVYGDIFFLYNLVTDYAVLKSAAIIWHGRGRPFLCCVAVNIIYTAIVYFFGLYALTPYILLAAAVFFGLKPKKAPHFAAMLLTVWVLCFITGSLSLGIMTLFDTGTAAVLLPAVVLLAAVSRAEKSVYLSRLSGIYPVELSVTGKKVFLDALVDSGNTRRVGEKSVIVADRSALAPLLPHIGTFFTAQCVTVSGTGELCCFYADAAVNGKTHENACVAISGVPIEGGFDALISAEII